MRFEPLFDLSEPVSATVSSIVMLVTCLYRSNNTIYSKQYNKLADIYRMAQESLDLVNKVEKVVCILLGISPASEV